MKTTVSSLCFLAILLSSHLLFSQVNRNPYIQAPTETTVVIAWRTTSAEASNLVYGTDSANLNLSSSDANPKTSHGLTLTGLSPNTQYYYQVQSTQVSNAVEYFHTAKSDMTAPFSFLHYGDCGYNNTIQNTIAGYMENENIDFAVVAGDVDQGTGDDYDDIFFGVYGNMLKNECHFTSIGNHDTYHDDAATYLSDFHMPTNNPQQTERYYSFTWGNTRFLAMDSNIPYTQGSDQYNWLLSELQCNDRQWLFVFFHHPPWTNAWDLLYYVPFQEYYEYEGNVDMRTDLVPLFEQYNVDFVLNGHSHCYQRGELNGVKYLISGGAGADALDFNTNSNAPNIDNEIYENHYVRFDVAGDVVTYSMVDINNTVLDQVVTTKSFTPYSAIINTNDATCSTAGSATAQVTGPYPPYTFNWSSGQTTANATNLSSGNYTLSISDSRGCLKIETINISGTSLSLNANASDSVCEGENDGSISLSPNGGSGNYTYDWSTGATSAAISNLAAGSYTVTVNDNNGCEEIQSFTISESPLPDASFTYSLNGTEIILMSTSSDADNLVWDFGDGNSNNSNSANLVHTYAEAGNYTLTLTVSNDCGSDAYSEVLTVNTTGIFNASPNSLQVLAQPNPFSEQTILYFDNPAAASYSFSLFDAKGQVLRQVENIKGNSLIINREDLPNGLYFFYLNGQKTALGKIIVAN